MTPVLQICLAFAKGVLGLWLVMLCLFAGAKVSSIYRIASATLDFLALRAETYRDCQANLAKVAKRERR